MKIYITNTPQKTWILFTSTQYQPQAGFRPQKDLCTALLEAHKQYPENEVFVSEKVFLDSEGVSYRMLDLAPVNFI